MKQNIFLNIILLILFARVVNSQTINEIPFLQERPLIDGSSKKELDKYPFQKFNYIDKSDSANKDYDVRYKLAYGMDFFYIYIESEGDSLTCRDRGYQAGDGFHLVFGLPKEGKEPTDEFYVLGFSAQKNESIFGRKIQWYRNINLEFKILGEETKFVTRAINGKLIFELLIPWETIYPYHPFLSPGIGFNLCFVKAVGKEEMNYYYILRDDNIQSEQHERLYSTLKFQTPSSFAQSQGYMILDKNHIYENDSITAKLSILSEGSSTQNFSIRLFSGENYPVKRINYELMCDKGLNYFEKKISLSNLFEGGYTIKYFIPGTKSTGTAYLSVLKAFDAGNFKKILDDSKEKISTGSYNSIKFLTDDISGDLNNLKDYETCAPVREKINSLNKILSGISESKDLLKNKTGIFRRAFLSNLDTAYRPYSVKIPGDYNQSKKYPLLVFLHGSGQDDRALSYGANSPDEFIELCPNARGTSNCYATPEALTDIKEAINDVIENYNIDSSKIVIGGFSMGGYGAYRFYYECPGLFKAVAVISGHPDLANKWMGSGYINFLDEKNLEKFKNTPVFIFHGSQDLNCPFALTKELVEKLRKTGTDVTFVIDDTGHGMTKIENRTEYYNWLKKIVGIPQ